MEVEVAANLYVQALQARALFSWGSGEFHLVTGVVAATAAGSYAADRRPRAVDAARRSTSWPASR